MKTRKLTTLAAFLLLACWVMPLGFNGAQYAGATQTEIIFQPGPGLNNGTDDGSINAGKDAFFYDCNGNWSGTDTIMLGNPRSTCNECNGKAYIQFNISTLPNEVDKVYLGVTHFAHVEYCYSMCEANFYYYPVLTEWNEISLPPTPPQEDSPVFGPINITFPNDFGKKEYDITEIYRKWKSGTVPNNGLVIYSPDVGCNNAAASWVVYSSDSLEIANRPYLRVITQIQPEVSPDIKANGLDGPITVPSFHPVSISINLNAGDKVGEIADWWVAVHTPFDPPGNWYSYVYPVGWIPGINMCAQAGLFDLAAFEVMNMSLPPGLYTFYFGVNDPHTSIFGPWWGLDSVEVTVQ